jgi:Cu-processing system permease protein
MSRIVRYALADILRSRMVIAYALLLSAASFGVFALAGDVPRGLAGMLSLTLLVVPLVGIVFSAIHWYQSLEFTELLAAQPVGRAAILLGQQAAVCSSLCVAFLAGAGLPVLLYAATPAGLTLLAAGIALTFIFSGLGLLAAVATRDKSRGAGLAILLWFYFALLHGGVMLFVLFSFRDYPLELPVLGLIALNPIDVARLAVLLQMDVSALMGQTGAMVRAMLGGATGIACSAATLCLWIAAPLAASLWTFQRKDL